MSITSPVKKLESKYVWAAPMVAALVYPVVLMALFYSARLLHNATHFSDAVVGTVALILCFLLTYSVPALGLAIAYRLGQISDPTPSQIRVRRFAHLVFASPPLFTCIGVVLLILGITNGDYIVWGIIWIPIVLLTLRSHLAIGTRIVSSPPFNWERLKVIGAIHGISALTILLIYLVPHIANHLTAFWSVNTHIGVMETLRQWYRSKLVEPLVIVLFMCQVITGLVLWRPRTTHQSDVFGTFQTASGAFLSVFITSHTMAVFLLARANGVDTNFFWASGQPAGMLGDPWSVRLIPHYTLAVWMLFTHLACGLRFRLLDRRIPISRANKVAWGIIGLGFIIALVIILAMFGFHIF
ncbi:MAG: hypothetical protein HC862_20405 [Scytonema sp. RU_4_4]|nr:hypothetical protein [Scytonema sp. RU_4_4]NJR76138.1 hypothetical protein [Scytonema sp. CRU_2_7]